MNQPRPEWRCDATAPDASPLPGGSGRLGLQPHREAAVALTAGGAVLRRADRRFRRDRRRCPDPHPVDVRRRSGRDVAAHRGPVDDLRVEDRVEGAAIVEGGGPGRGAEPLDPVDEPGHTFGAPLGAEDVEVLGEVGPGELALALEVAAALPPVGGELRPAGPVRPVAVDLDDVDLRRPRLVVRLAPEGRAGAEAAGDPDPGLPVAVLLGELVLGMDAADGEGLTALRPALDPLGEDAAADDVVRRIAPAVVAVGALTPAEPVRPLRLVERVAVEVVGERQDPLRRRIRRAGLLRTNGNGRPGTTPCRPFRSLRGARSAGVAPLGAGGPGGVPRGGRD